MFCQKKYQDFSAREKRKHPKTELSDNSEKGGYMRKCIMQSYE